jgi:hypothetical protein
VLAHQLTKALNPQNHKDALGSPSMARPDAQNCSAVNILLSKIKKLVRGYAKMSSDFSKTPRSERDIKRNSPNYRRRASERATLPPKSNWRIGKALISEKVVRMTASFVSTLPKSQLEVSKIKQPKKNENSDESLPKTGTESGKSEGYDDGPRSQPQELACDSKV